MLVLVVNAGSSSLKCQLIQTDGKISLMKCAADRVGSPEVAMNVKFAPSFDKVRLDAIGKSIPECLELLLDEMERNQDSPINSLDDIEAIGNRYVSGGERFTDATMITDDNLPLIKACELLAPLHNPPATACIEYLMERMPNKPQVAVFDTAFHQTMPPKAYMFPLPLKYYEQYGIRRYGFHGTSHRYAANRAAGLLGRDLKDLGLITCHLGNGGSISAIENGKSIDTSMGFTPLDGLMMGTRCGSIDPSIVTYLMREEGLSYDEMDDILNKKSGVLGITGTASDMRAVLDMAEDGNETAKLAIDMYVYKIQKAIGSYYATITRLDAIVLTAGIGENSAPLREKIFAGLAHMGMILDKERNDVAGAIGMNRIISIDDSPIKICVVTTDEEMRIARETDAIVSGESTSNIVEDGIAY